MGQGYEQRPMSRPVTSEVGNINNTVSNVASACNTTKGVDTYS